MTDSRSDAVVSGGDRTDEIRGRLAGASDGPWERRFYDGAPSARSRLVRVVAPPNEYGFDRVSSLADYLSREDAEFIAHAREDVPWLLDENARLAAENAELRRIAYQGDEEQGWD